MTKFAAGRVQALRATTPPLQSRPDLADPAAAETGLLVSIQRGEKPDPDTRAATALPEPSQGTGAREKATVAHGTNLAQIIRPNFCFSDSGKAWRT